MVEIFMPKAGMDMKEGVLIRWLKEVGDPVEQDEPVMEIETDKITMEAESPGKGILLQKLAKDGDTVPVLSVVGYVGEPGEKLPEQAQTQEQAAEPAAEAAPAAEETAKSVSVLSGSGLGTPCAKRIASELGVDLKEVAGGADGIVRKQHVLDYKEKNAVKATPLAKRVAADKGIDLRDVEKSGSRIFREDVEKCDAANKPAPAQKGELVIESRKPLSGMRKVLGERMFESYSSIPAVTQTVLADMTELFALRKKINSLLEDKISVNDFVLKATAMAVRENPLARSIIQDGELITYANVNLGFAVGVENGLFVPVIRDADKLTLSEISAKAKELAEKARTGKITIDEYSGGVFTVSNMGMYNVFSFTPIINPPEPAIIGIAAARDEVQVDENNNVTVRKIAPICLTYNHRIFDGISAAKLENRVKYLLEHPEQMLI